MGHPSTPEFCTFHALRIKGLANAETLVEMTALDETSVAGHLNVRADQGHTLFRENRSLWQLTPDGRQAHLDELAADLDGIDVVDAFGEVYPTFVDRNLEFKELCGAWQLRNGEPNDHSDADYDAEIVARLDDLHSRARDAVARFGVLVERFSPYADRLDVVLGRLHAGETNMFTGVMCGSYHDVWMELHEDLILTQGIDRAAEGSF